MCRFLKNTLPLLLFLIITYSVKSQSIKILPLGNSITQSNSDNLSYRYPLWTKLIDDNYSFEFVGTKNSNHGGNPIWPNYNGFTFDQDHEGHWGWRCDEILAQLPTWLNSYTPDIALLHLGTNDLYQGNGNPLNILTTINEIKSIITVLRNDNPNVIILLAKLIPSSNSLLINKIPLLNNDIPQIAIDMVDSDSPIYIVDQFAGFNAADDTFDGVHPNSSGEEKMAEKWHFAINSVVSLPEGYRVSLNVLLEGPFNGVDMNMGLQSHVPLTQPFNQAPWYYPGNENVAIVPMNAVDWLLIEIRDTTDASLAGPMTILDRKACFLDFTGQIIDINGSVEIEFNSTFKSGIFAVVYHRNHLPVISANQLIESGGVYSYDFSIGSATALGGILAQASLGGGMYGLLTGDFNADGTINSSDINATWTNHAGITGYNESDGNLNGNVNNADKNEYWFKNNGKSSFVPD